MTEAEQANEWTRYVKALCLQDSKLQVLAHLDKGMRVAVLKNLGARTAEDVFTMTQEKP